MKPTDESAGAHYDFGDESTSVMGGDLLSSLTERSRRIDVSAPPPVPEPEISIVTDEVEPVTTMRPAAPPLPAPPSPPAASPQLMIVDGEYPALGDEESTMMMEEPEPTTLAVRPHRESAPSPAPLPPPAPAVAPQPLPAVAPQPLPAQAAPDPQWAAESAPRVLATIRVSPLPAPEPATEPESAAKPSVGSRRVSALAAVAVGVAVWTLGLGHHEPPPAAVIAAPAIAAPAPSASSVAVTPWDLQTRATLILGNVRTALGSLMPPK